jgi:hypothetical protein
MLILTMFLFTPCLGYRLGFFYRGWQVFWVTGVIGWLPEITVRIF